MAQTRACAKALRNVLAWVVVLAGYRATPAEEMQGSRAPASVPRDTSALITLAQQKRFIALAHEHGWSDVEAARLLEQAGVKRSSQIPRVQYQALCQLLEQGPAAVLADVLPDNLEA